MNNNCSGCVTNVAVKTKSTSLAAVSCTNPIVYFFEQIKPYVDNESYTWPAAINLVFSSIGGIVQQNGNLCCSECENDPLKQVYYFGTYTGFLNYAIADNLRDNPDYLCCLNKYSIVEPPDAIDSYFNSLIPPCNDTDFVDCLGLWPLETFDGDGVVEYGNFGNESALCTIWNYFNDLGVSEETILEIMSQILEDNIMIVCHGCDIYIGSSSAGVDFMQYSCLLTPPTPPDAFISVWRVGLDNGNTLTLPLHPSGTYNFFVDWGDGINNTVISDTGGVHTYAVPGDYTVTITGTIQGWSFEQTPLLGVLPNQLLEITNWGDLRLGNLIGGFKGCSNLTLMSVIGTLNLTGQTSLKNMFNGCSSLTTINNINSWDTSIITSMEAMFQNCYNFNDNIGGWDTSLVKNMFYMFYNAQMFNNGGNASISSWNTSNVINMSTMFYRAYVFNQPIITSGSSWDTSNVTNMSFMFGEALAFNQPIGNWNTANVQNMGGMFYQAIVFNQSLATSGSSWDTSNVTNMGYMFNGATLFNQPLSTWDTSNVTNMGYMFANASSFNQNIGSWTMLSVSNTDYMFLNAIAFNNLGSTSINSWFFMFLQNTEGMFENAINFNQPIGSWPMGNVTITAYMFRGATLFNQNIGGWNVSSVISMEYMFRDATSFNNLSSPSINNWTPSSAQFMNNMFDNAQSFNQPIGSWPTLNVVTMTSMFRDAIVFDQNIGSWNVANVRFFSLMFQNAREFDNLGNNSIGGWILNIAFPIKMILMFKDAVKFNRNIGAWNTTRVNDMSAMFNNAALFNQDIGNWNTGLVTNMSQMFEDAFVFNNGGSATINNWNTSAVNDMNNMFNNARVFNQPISSWNTALVTNMRRMFRNAYLFNQSLATSGSSWNVSNVQNMSEMFQDAYAFNKPISSWNISNVTNISNFMLGKSFTNYTASYLDDIYNAWAALTVQPNLNISFGPPPTGIKYTLAGAPGRASLVGTDNWSITDGGI